MTALCAAVLLLAVHARSYRDHRAACAFLALLRSWRPPTVEACLRRSVVAAAIEDTLPPRRPPRRLLGLTIRRRAAS